MKLQGIGCIQMGPTVNGLAWNVKWVLCTFSCGVVILQESKLEVINRPIAIKLWGRRQREWLYLPSVGRLGGIIVIWYPQVLELPDSHIRSFSICYKFNSLEDNFE